MNEKRIRVVGNQFVDAACYLDFDPLEVGINEHVYYPVLMDMLAQKEALSDDEFKNFCTTMCLNSARGISCPQI